MLIAILNICSKEELEEEEAEDEIPVTPTSQAEESAERRTVIKNKILAVGRMSRVFALLRCVFFGVRMRLSGRCTEPLPPLCFARPYREEAERVSELKSASGTGKLPYGTLALGSEGIKDAVHNFDEARKVDIENERVSCAVLFFFLRRVCWGLVAYGAFFPMQLPPDLIDADEAGPASPAGEAMSPRAGSPARDDGAPSTPGSPSESPSSPSSGTGHGHRRGHSRTSSLGTTMSSPSNRRRSLESTISMIRYVLWVLNFPLATCCVELVTDVRLAW